MNIIKCRNCKKPFIAKHKRSFACSSECFYKSCGQAPRLLPRAIIVRKKP